MKCTTWSRSGGFVSVVLFANKTSAAVSTKIYKTEKGAKGANMRLKERCGDNWEKMNLPYRTTNPKHGSVTVNYKTENLASI